MNSLPRTLREVIAGLANEAAKEIRKVPSHRFDGEEIKSAEDIAAALAIPVIEAKARIRRVRSAAGVRKYNQPMGSIITRDVMPESKMPAAQWSLVTNWSTNATGRKAWRATTEDGWKAVLVSQPGNTKDDIRWRLTASNENRKLGPFTSYHSDPFDARDEFDKIRAKHQQKEMRRVVPESKKRLTDTKDEYWGVYGRDWSYGDEAEQALPEWDENDYHARQQWALKEVKDMGIEWEGHPLNTQFFEVANRVMQHHESQYPGFSATVTRLGTTYTNPGAFAHNQIELGKELVDEKRGLWRENVMAAKTTGVMWNAEMFAGFNGSGHLMASQLMQSGQEGSSYKSHRTEDLRKQFPEYSDAQLGFMRTTVHELGHTVMRMILGDLQSYEEMKDTENRDYYREMFWYYAADIMGNHGVGNAEEIYEAMVHNQGHSASVALPSDIMTKILSKYGGTNLHEMMAEIWAEYQLDSEPRQFAAEMGTLMEKVLEEWLFWNVLEEVSEEEN